MGKKWTLIRRTCSNCGIERLALETTTECQACHTPYQRLEIGVDTLTAANPHETEAWPELDEKKQQAKGQMVMIDPLDWPSDEGVRR